MLAALATRGTRGMKERRCTQALAQVSACGHRTAEALVYGAHNSGRANRPSSDKMHVIVTSFGSDGDFNPLLAIAAALVRARTSR